MSTAAGLRTGPRAPMDGNSTDGNPTEGALTGRFPADRSPTGGAAPPGAAVRPSTSAGARRPLVPPRQARPEALGPGAAPARRYCLPVPRVPGAVLPGAVRAVRHSGGAMGSCLVRSPRFSGLRHSPVCGVLPVCRVSPAGGVPPVRGGAICRSPPVGGGRPEVPVGVVDGVLRDGGRCGGRGEVVGSGTGSRAFPRCGSGTTVPARPATTPGTGAVTGPLRGTLRGRRPGTPRATCGAGGTGWARPPEQRTGVTYRGHPPETTT